MLKFAIIVLALLTLIVPIVAILIIVDRDKKSIVPLILGGFLFVLVEACLVIPLINFLGYNIFYIIVGIIIIEVLRWLVLRLYLKKTGQKDSTHIMYYFAGYVLLNLFVVWGIDSVATAAVVLLSDYSIMEQGEVWISILMALIKLIMIYSYTSLAAVAVRQNRIRYVFLAMAIHVVSDENIILELCSILNVNRGIGIMFLAAAACIMLVVNDKMSHLWKGKSNEN